MEVSGTDLNDAAQAGAPRLVACDAEALQRLLNWASNVPAAYGRDALLDAVVASVQPLEEDSAGAKEGAV